MKYTCSRCGKIVSDKNVVKNGWFYFCNEHCKDNYENKVFKIIMTYSILGLVLIFSVIIAFFNFNLGIFLIITSIILSIIIFNDKYRNKLMHIMFYEKNVKK